jgi:hypothetical protein
MLFVVLQKLRNLFGSNRSPNAKVLKEIKIKE